MHTVRSRAAFSPYSLLGVTAASNPEEVRAAYKRRALETHPDKGGDPEEFLRVKQAYEAITTGKATPPGTPGRPPRRPPHFNPDVADPPYGVPVSERLARKRPPQPVEEELNTGFSAVPGGPTAKRVAERMVAGGVAQARQSASLSARVSVQAASAKIKAPAEVSVVKLWEKLTKLSPKDRTTAISNLDSGLREQLSKYLATRKNCRGHDDSRAGTPGPARPSPSPEPSKKVEEVNAGSDSDSGESSSSESSGSSATSNAKDAGGAVPRAVLIGEGHIRRVVGKSSGEAG